MESGKLVLRELREEDEGSFRKAVHEFQQSNDGHIFALGWEDGCGFKEYIDRLSAWSRGEQLPDGYVPGSFYAGFVAHKVVGRISLRHQLNDHLEKIDGHIGYCVVPSEEGKGYATEMLRQSLEICKQLGIGKALLTCDHDNAASRRVIEKCGGICEGITDYPELEKQKLRFWIQVTRDTKKPPAGNP